LRFGALLVNGSPKYDAVVADIKAARKHVHLEYYIYAGDRTGTLIRDALVEALGRGVKVRLLMDGAGSSHQGRIPASRSATPARKSRSSTRCCAAMPHLRPLLNFRSHRKIAVIDGRIGYTGGINVTDDENDRLNPKATSATCTRASRARRWRGCSASSSRTGTTPRARRRRGRRPVPALAPGRCAVQMIPPAPTTRRADPPRLPGAIHSADRRVWLSTPYFVPTTAALYALTIGGDARAGHAGDDAAKSDSRLVDLAARSYFEPLLKAGVRVFEYQPRMLHTKALLVDDAFAILGSANFDNRSFATNFEMSIAVHEAHIAKELEQVWYVDQAESIEVKKDRPRASFPRRLGEAVARLASPML
jgi:cardiolipin synthase